jgi:carbamoyltransferase
MITWGLVGNSHDASLAIFDNNELVSAALAKEFSGIHHDPDINWGLIEWAQTQRGMPDQLVWYERPFLKTLRQYWAGQGWLLKENNIKQYVSNACSYLGHVPIKYTQHHTSHAAYAYYTQPHDRCAVICLDSIGEFECLTIWACENGRMHKIHSQSYPHSLGLFYSAMTQRIGLVPQRDEYLVVRSAQMGDPGRLSHLIRKELIDVDHTKSKPQQIRMRENLHRGCKWWHPELSSRQDLYDIAAATQAVFEYCLATLSIWTKVQTGMDHLALAGGGALNKQAVDLIRNQWQTVWVPPNPGDPGSCVGGVLAQTRQRIDNIDKAWYKKV